MGLLTNHSYVVVLSAFSVVPRRRPLETFIIPLGTVIATRWLSGSSACVSLLGHHALAPSPCTAVAIHGWPRLSFFQANPPSHGGFFATRGLPRKYEVIVRRSPARGATAGVTNHALPSWRTRSRVPSCVTLSSVIGVCRSSCSSVS